MDELDPRHLLRRFAEVRGLTERLCAPLAIEDYVLQSMPDASPAKWHLAHTTWFFETFLLTPLGEAPFHPRYGFLFNSYYEAIGERHARPHRGMLSRPTVEEIRRYRAAVDERVRLRIEGGELTRAARAVIELGLHHEQQHQELLLTDLLHALAQNPLRPAYRERSRPSITAATMPFGWVSFEGGLCAIGHEGERFSFDNESPRHRIFLRPFALADRLVTAGDYLAFMGDRGYARPELWLSEGYTTAREQGWEAPLYWERDGDRWAHFTLDGMRAIDAATPVCHLSYFEADAFARWSGARLPTEAEWEVATANAPIEGNFVESDALHPLPAKAAERGLRQLFGDVWEWTASSYSAYPGFAPAPGAIGEYNGKFMCNQTVLRGGSCASSSSHLRASYRNFFPTSARWQFSGVRLAKDA